MSSPSSFLPGGDNTAPRDIFPAPIFSGRNDKIRWGTIQEYVQQHYQNKVYVDDVAALVHLSTPAYCRYFKKHTWMTFTEFVNQYRISQARTLLLRDSSISAVSDALGFQNISHFNKFFKKSTGDAPGAFRKKYANNQKP